MFKIIQKLKRWVKNFVIKSKISFRVKRMKVVLNNNQAEGFVDTGIKILIAVIVGTLLLWALSALFNSGIMPNVTSKIIDLFNFAG